MREAAETVSIGTVPEDDETPARHLGQSAQTER